MDLVYLLLDSFKELFSDTKRFLRRNKKIIVKLSAFGVFSSIVYILSITLTKISFLDKLDLANPNNVAELQPLLNVDQRKIGLFALFFMFAFISVSIGRWKGFGSLLGLILSAFAVYKLLIPLLLLGWNPLLATFIIGVVVLSATIFFSHGFNLKTFSAVLGSVLTLFATMILGELFRIWIQVSGYYGEATYNLLVNTQINFDMAGIVVAGIILAGIGLIDDVTVTQVSVVQEILDLDPKLSVKKIYDKAMNVGRDHMGTMVNSLFWAYAAVDLPLLMLINYIGVSLEKVITYEFIIEEILRTVVSSMGLVLAVPITTFLGSYLMKKYYKPSSEAQDEDRHLHHHS